MYFFRKNRTNILSAIVFFLVVFSLSDTLRSKQTGLFSNKIDADVAKQLSQAAPDELIPVELAVTGAISAQELTRFLDSAYITLDDKRRAGLKLLHERADETQRELLNYLHRLEKTGEVIAIESNWLTNTISVKLKVTVVDSVANRNDVVSVFQNPSMEQIIPDYPEPNKTFSSSTQTVESNLTTIGADTAWAMGYTGKGRIVCVFDYEGVDGHHPALANNWKGLDGDSAAAWSGRGGTSFPVARRFIEPDSSHGTALTGIMIGHDDIGGDTIGVAPGATWIAATGFDFAWAVDPDRNPNTTDDIPDVINISAGYPWGRCRLTWDYEVEMAEALGVVVVFAAGNTGPNPFTVWDPANRADDSLTNFAVGSIDHRYGTIYWNSSRGPSACDSISVKPNVTAPGAYILCAIPGSGYAYRGGTSMASPHVAGAVAILREFAPDATARQIKEALLAGATPTGLGHPNNDYGWGVISIPKSLQYLAQTFSPDLRISGFGYEKGDIADTLVVEVRVLNRAYRADSVWLKFEGNFRGLTLLTDSIYFGPLDYMEEAVGNIPLRFVFDDTLLPGPTFTFTYSIRAARGYIDTLTAVVAAGEVGTSQGTAITSDWWQMGISNLGALGISQELLTYVPCTLQYCPDFFWPYLNYSIALIVGTDTNRVSDINGDRDFVPDIHYPFEPNHEGAYADQEAECTFHDGNAKNQIGVRIHQRSYFWSDPTNNDFVFVEYQLTNPTPKYISGIYVGLKSALQDGHIDSCSTIDSIFVCHTGYSDAQHLGYLKVVPCGLDTIRYQGIAVLNNEGTYAYSVGPANARPPDAEKFASITGGIRDTGLIGDFLHPFNYVISNGPFTLEPGQSDTIAFAVVCGNSLEQLETAVGNARKKWKQVSPSQNLPKTSLLSQNYPNPFNPSTTIAFDLPKNSPVKLIVYNILGQQVAKLIDEPMLAGSHQVIWDGKNSGREMVASGVYFYRLETASFSQTKKMILLR